MELFVVLFFVTLGGSRYAQSIKYGIFEGDRIFNADEAHEECVQRGGSLPLPQDEQENDYFRQFLIKENVSSAWLDVKSSLFPWVEQKSGSIQAMLSKQGCFEENQNFIEVNYESRRTFNLNECRRTCLSQDYEFSAVKGKSQNTFSADEISCMCSRQLKGAVQVSRARCPDRCETVWCRVDRTNRPDLLVYVSNTVGVDVTWENDEQDSLSNKHSCGLYSPSTASLRKYDCQSKEEVICITKNGTALPAGVPMSWPRARQFCEHADSYLPILSESKNIATNKPFWNSITAFHWQTNSGIAMVYSNWGADSQPLTPDRECTVLIDTGYWVASPCTLNLQLVCQKEDVQSGISQAITGPGSESEANDITKPILATSSDNPDDWVTREMPNTSGYLGPAGGPVAQSDRLSAGTIAGVIVGVILGVVIIIGVILLFIVACSKKDKDELPRTTRNSKIYRAASLSMENPDYISMSRMVSTVSSEVALVPNGWSASLHPGPGQRDSAGTDLESHITMIDNDMYNTDNFSRHTCNGEVVYEEPNLNRRPTICPNTEQDGYVLAEMGESSTDEQVELELEKSLDSGGLPCSAPLGVRGRDNLTYLPEKVKSGPYDTPERVDPSALTPPPTPTYGNVSSPDMLENGVVESSEHIYINA